MIAPSRRLAAAGAVLALVLTGCTSGEAAPGTTTRTVVSTLPPLTTLTVTTDGSDPPSTSAGTASSSASGTRRITSTPSSPASSSPASSAPASSATGAPTPAGTAPTTALPAAVGGECPYLSADEVAQLAGQRTGPGTVITASPAPICVFTRSDGGWLAAVRVFRTPDAASAAAAVDERVPVDSSSPAEQPAGWTGGYLGLPSGAPEYPEARSVYGVSKGTSAVVAWTNQAQSIKSRRLVTLVIQKLQL